MSVFSKPLFLYLICSAFIGCANSKPQESHAVYQAGLISHRELLTKFNVCGDWSIIQDHFAALGEEVDLEASYPIGEWQMIRLKGQNAGQVAKLGSREAKDTILLTQKLKTLSPLVEDVQTVRHAHTTSCVPPPTQEVEKPIEAAPEAISDKTAPIEDPSLPDTPYQPPVNPPTPAPLPPIPAPSPSPAPTPVIPPTPTPVTPAFPPISPALLKHCDEIVDIGKCLADDDCTWNWAEGKCVPHISAPAKDCSEIGSEKKCNESDLECRWNTTELICQPKVLPTKCKDIKTHVACIDSPLNCSWNYYSDSCQDSKPIPPSIKQCESITSEAMCNISALGCQWNTTDKKCVRFIHTTDTECSDFENKSTCENISAHPTLKCAWRSYSGGTELCVSQASPNDPLLLDQWHLLNSAYGILGGANVLEAWKISPGSKDMTIGIVDLKIQSAFLDLSNTKKCEKRYQVYDLFNTHTFHTFNPYTHGSKVTAVAAACTNNKTLMAGVDRQAKVMGTSLTGVDTMKVAEIYPSVVWLAGIDLCGLSTFPCPYGFHPPKNSNPADVINLSLGGNTSLSGASLEKTALQLANQKSVTIVVAAGNKAENIAIAGFDPTSGITLDSPSSVGFDIVVGASDISGKAANFSNWGPLVDIFAPGQGIPVAYTSSSLDSINGTSFAAPIITGIVSLMKSVRKDLTPAQAKYILRRTAKQRTCDEVCPDTYGNLKQLICKNDMCPGGWLLRPLGLVDAKAAVEMASAKNLPNEPIVESDSNYLYTGASKAYTGISTKEAHLHNYGTMGATVRFRNAKYNDPKWAIWVNGSKTPLRKAIVEPNKEITISFEYEGSIGSGFPLVIYADIYANTTIGERVDTLALIVWVKN